MTDDERTEAIMARMGFRPDDDGPMVTALRKEMRHQVQDHGLVNRSGGSWAPQYGFNGMLLPPEQRARAFLEVEWSLAQGYHCEVKCMDRPWGKRTDVRTMKRTYFVKLDDVPVWLRDRWRSFLLDIRIRWDKLRGIRNPYSR